MSITPAPTVTGDRELREEIARRRTFAIISHPDAGKTTLTEKFLLYGGAVEEAGSVRARRNARKATSDWMAMEQQRGISITSTVLQFDAFGKRFNLLDTPGHEDFSEDTYRTLIAADAAVMVLDAARGVEPQTLKLFDVCRMRGLPVLTFINKLDQPGQDPLALLDEIERVLELNVVPMNWPLGDGPNFGGVYDLVNRAVLQFERTEGNRYRAPVTTSGLDDPTLTTLLGEAGHAALREQVELVEAITPPFDEEAFLAGLLSPVFFGSALNNFGVEPFLEALTRLAPPPGPQESDRGPIDPASDEFSGFIFKLQANMDPQHRDSMAFLRICSGRFEKDMSVYHPRLGRKVRMSRPHRLFGGERKTVEEAYPGDIVGLINPGLFLLGDTICTGKPLRYPPMPRFEPESFATLHNRDLGRSKQFQRGLAQLEEEGAVQVFWRTDGTRSSPVVAAVGQLQFDVVVSRLQAEYSVETGLEHLAHRCIREVRGDREAMAQARWPLNGMRLRDDEDRQFLLVPSVRDADFFVERNPGIELSAIG